MSYTAPTLEELKTSVARDLRDPDMETFEDESLGDFINEAIAELNRIKPNEVVVSVSDTESLLTPLLDDRPLDYVWALEFVTDTGYREYIPPNNPNSTNRNGWEYYAGTILMGTVWQQRAERSFETGDVTISIYGYIGRDAMTENDEQADFDFDDEQAVRAYCRMAGLRALDADRSLFQQWIAANNNTDISSTQLLNMVQTAESTWARLAKRIFVPRRPPMGGG